jgi:hypothetical protein
MKKMEHWAHRLFPKMPFDEVVERVERLGSKKEVQTCIKKIRLDMPILTEDFVGSDRDNDDDDVVRRGDDDVVRHSDDEQGTSAQVCCHTLLVNLLANDLRSIVTVTESLTVQTINCKS